MYRASKEFATQALSTTKQTLQRTVNMSLYAPDEWADLKENDAVLVQAAKSQQMGILSNDTGS